MNASIPEGFTPIDEAGTFLGHIGGLHWRLGEGAAETCVVLERKHTNPMGVAHGGLVMTLMDITLGATAHSLMPPGAFPLTVQHSCNFIRGARLGDLLRCEARSDAATRSLIYVSARSFVGEQLVATGAGVFRIPSPQRPAS